MLNKHCKNIFLLYLILAFFAVTSIAQVSSQRKTTSIGRLALTVNNFATFGKPDVRSNTQGPSSMCFPKGSGVEHLFEAGLWIGAYVDGQIRVSSSSVDASAGYTPGGSGFEFTPTSIITEKSKLPSSANFTSSAVSHQDFVMNFTDSFVVIPGTSFPINGHQNPLKASCKLETYAWNYSFADYFVIANYEITNNSNQRWDSVYLGIFSDLVVRNVNITRDASTSFFNKGRNGINKKLNSIYSYQSFGDDIAYTQSYGAIQFLGIDWNGLFFNPNKPDTFLALGYPKPNLNYNFWNFNSVAAPWNSPASDQERYIKLSNDIDSITLNGSNGPVFGPPANWLQLLSAGPLISVNPGEKFTFTVAFVCAAQNGPLSYLPQGSANIITTPESERDLIEHLSRTRATYLGEDQDEKGVYRPELDLNNNGKLDRYVLPEPPNSPHTKLVTSEGKIEVYWDKHAENSIDPISRRKDFEGYRLYRTNIGDDLGTDLIGKANLIGQWDHAGNEIGYNNGFKMILLDQPVKFDGDTTSYTYKYTFNNVNNGWQYLIMLTAFDEGDKSLGIESQESSFTESEFRAFAGKSVNNFNGQESKVGVYPNPYNTKAAWDGENTRLRKLVFYNLPSSAEIIIYSASGDVINTIQHQSESYNGSDSRWFNNFGDVTKTVTSGGEHAWDLLNDSKTQIATGVYLFTVKDLNSGQVQSGSFAVIK
jgi:hypothetical protein